MASQAEKDTAAAKAKQGGGQAAKDTAAAKAKQNNSNQAAKDTARAKSRQNGGDGGTSDDFAAREAANGLTNTTSGFGGSAPLFAEREALAGLTETTVGRDDFYSKRKRQRSMWSSFDSGEMLAGSPMDFKADTPIGATEDLFAFKIIQYNNDPSKVVVALGSVQSPNGNPVFPPQSNIDPQSGSTFSSGSTLYLNVTLTNGTVTAAQVSTSAGTVSSTKAVVAIGSVSSGGFISQFVRNNLFIYSCGDNQFFQGILS